MRADNHRAAGLASVFGLLRRELLREGAAMMRIVLALVLLLAACAPPGALSYLPGGTPGGTVQRVFVATNRNLAPSDDPGLFEQGFGEARAPRLRYAWLDVSVPAVHRAGLIEWPGQPGSGGGFVVTDEARFDRAAEFLRAVEAAKRHPQDETVVFVHGYSTNNAKAVYRLAQIAHDFQLPVPVVAFSWPSSGLRRGYVYDRDSVIYSRDALEELLVTLTEGGHNVLLVGHSMGTQLVMETLRQMSIGGRGDVLARLNGVALISPDIDEDVFLRQAARIKPFPEPFAVLVSHHDRALNLSAWLTGKPVRLTLRSASVLTPRPSPAELSPHSPIIPATVSTI